MAEEKMADQESVEEETVEETVEKRIQVYLDETQPLIDYYTKSGAIVTIDGDQDINKVFEDIRLALGSEN